MKKLVVSAIALLALSSAVFAAQETPREAPKDQPAVSQSQTQKQASPTNTRPEPSPFSDVPKNHWAYESVRQLQKAGVLVGYPKDTFQGKREVTRYEFAIAIAKMMPVISQAADSTQATRQQIDDLDRRISALERGEVAPPAPAVPTLKDTPTKAEIDSLSKLINEFSGELQRMRVNVDALKKEVAELNKRVTRIDKEKIP